MEKLLPGRSKALSIRCFLASLMLIVTIFWQPLSIHAQPKYGITSTTILTPPYPITLDGFVAEGGTKISLQINPTDINISQYPVLLKLVISGNGITLESKSLMIHEPVYLNGNEPVTLNGSDLQDFFNPDNLNFTGYSKTQYQRNGRLPEGVYYVSFELYDVLRRIPVSTVRPGIAYLFLNEVPMLNLPLNGDLISAAGTQAVNFKWTTRHSPLAGSFFTPEYLFELWEIIPEGRNAYDVVKGTRPYYVTTLSSPYLAYGVAEPQLQPGRSYAWRVRETDPEGRTLFKNDGYTEVYTFIYGRNCPAPELKADKVGTSFFTVNWQADMDQKQFELRYRDKKKKNTEWYTQTSNLLSGKVDNLKSNTVYEVEVCAICGDQRSEYSNRLDIGTRQNTSYKCGQVDSSKFPSNKNPLRKLARKDVFKAYGFDVEVADATGGAGTYTGKGYVLVPLLNFIKIEVTFNNIQINEEYELIGGEVKTVYNLKNSLTFVPGEGLLGLSEIDDLAKLLAGDKEKNKFNEIADKTVSIDSVKEVRIEGNRVVITDANGKKEEISTSSGQLVAIKTEEGKEYVVDTGTGTIYSSGNSGQKAPEGAPSGSVSTAAQAGKGASPKYNVSFIPHKLQEYGFDYPTDKSPAANYEQVEITGKPALVPWKSLETGRTERLIAGITGGPADSVRYYRESNNVVMTALEDGSNVQKSDGSNPQTFKQLLLNGTGRNDEDKLFAWYAAYNGDTAKTYNRILAGQLNTVSYEKVSIKVVLVPVNNSSCPEPGYVKEELNKIYKSAVVNWDVQKAGSIKVTFPGTLFDNTDDDNLMDYTADMKAVINAFKDDPTYSRETYYLFFLDDASDQSIKGYMPLKKQFGFIFKYKQYPDEYLRTVAHELGHGAFRLWHTFSSNNKYVQSKGSTDNLMDYADAKATALNKYQWDWMHDPEWRLYWFEEEDEGVLGTTDDFQKLLQMLAYSGVNTFAFGVKCESPLQDGYSYYADGYRYFIFKYSGDGENYKIEQIKSIGFPNTVLSKIKVPELIIPGLYDKLLILNRETLGVVTPYLCDVLEQYPNACSIKELTNIPNFFEKLGKDISKCINQHGIAPGELTQAEITSILWELQKQARPNQKFEFVYKDKFYALNAQNQAELIENPESDADINAGNWNDGSIDMKMRIGFNADGILHFAALGIRKDLPLAPGKTASLTEISQNMLARNNVMLKEYRIKDIKATLNSAGANFDSEAFPDGKKVEINKDATFVKILCEAGGIGISFLKTAEVEKPVYLEDNPSTIKAPPIATGTVESIGMIVTDITSAVNMVYDIVTDKQARTQAKDGFVQIGKQIKDNPTTLFPILLDVVLEEFTGSTAENYEEMTSDATNKGRKHHLTTKTTVRTTVSIFTSGKILSQLPEMSLEVAKKMAKEQFFNKLDDLGDVADDVLDQFRKKLKALPDGGERLLDDFKDLTDAESLRKLADNPDFIDNWKALDDAGVDESIRKNVDAVTDPDAVEDAVQITGKTKPTWAEIQAYWKRGNDFNLVGRNKYRYNEINLADGKRLDSYIPGKEIISRKATTLSDIQPSTFEGYLKELTTKYKKGKIIRSDKYKTGSGAIDGQVLSGDYYLEIPTSNKAYYESSKTLQDLAKKYVVKIKYLDE